MTTTYLVKQRNGDQHTVHDDGDAEQKSHEAKQEGQELAKWVPVKIEVPVEATLAKGRGHSSTSRWLDNFVLLIKI